MKPDANTNTTALARNSPLSFGSRRSSRGVRKRWSAWYERGRHILPVTAVVFFLILVWPVVLLVFDQSRLVVLSPTVQVALEASITLTRLFAALVLLLLPGTNAGRRLYWVAGGSLLLGIGAFGFGYLQPFVDNTYDVNNHSAAIYASLAVWTAAGILLSVGLLTATAPEIPRWLIILAAVALGGCCLLLSLHAGSLPALVAADSPSVGTLPGELLGRLSPRYWALAVVPLALAIAAAAGAVRHCPGRLGGWLGAGLILHVGAQWHNLFWPSAFSPMLTTATLLRFCSGLAVAIGAVLELRRLVLEHAALLTVEQEYSKRLGEMAVLKADFTAMVAHELGTPIAAIRAFTEMLTTGAVAPAEQGRIFATIQTETDVLAALVADVRVAAAAERADFAIRPRSIAVAVLLADAAAFARALPGDHPFSVTGTLPERVLADPERIGQVLRNLLSNAAKYSPPGTPIEVRAICKERRVRIQVADRGFGVHPYDLARIFEKFGRGRDEQERKIQGVGLGLYLSRRIVQAHGTDLTVESLPGVGSVFGFELEIAQ